MTPRQHIRELVAGHPVPRCGFWLGKPHPDTVALLNSRLGTSSLEEIQVLLQDDVRWITPQYQRSTYRHPLGKSMRPWRDANPHGLSRQGLLSRATGLQDLEAVEFPEARWLDFSETLDLLDAAGDYYRLSGFWSPFFHDLGYLFGTEELLYLMLENPELVQAATDRICGFYLEANERFFAAAGSRMDALFIGNDFGTQQGLVLSPGLFRQFFLPWIVRFAEQAHRHRYACILHSCGAVGGILGDLVQAGIDCMHPLQTTARGMEPETLGPEFRQSLTFMGGVDRKSTRLNSSHKAENRQSRMPSSA